MLDLAVPRLCLACGERLRTGAATLGLCRACAGRLRPPPPSGCASCGRALAAAAPAGFQCGACRARPPAYERLFARFSYEPPLQAVVAALKFRRLEALGAELGRAVAVALAPQLAACDAVVPVPLHWRRQLGRGYNQAERIARPLAAALDRPCREWLRRPRSAPAQARLDRAARLRGPRAAFRARRGAELAGAHVLLVDDVVTTGSTLDAAARALRAAGAARVWAVAVARTPGPDER
jgi:ComF family protein